MPACCRVTLDHSAHLPCPSPRSRASGHGAARPRRRPQATSKHVSAPPMLPGTRSEHFPLLLCARCQVQAATRKKRRSHLWGPVRPHMLQQQAFQVRRGAGRLVAGLADHARLRMPMKAVRLVFRAASLRVSRKRSSRTARRIGKARYFGAVASVRRPSLTQERAMQDDFRRSMSLA